MIKDILYQGYTANPSDFDCQDGTLAASLNIIHEDGALRPIQPPTEIAALPQGERLFCIHKSASFTHYIAIDQDNHFVWYNEASPKWERHAIADITLHDPASATCFGNIVSVICTDGIFKFLWTSKEGTADYKPLANILPETKLSFGLKGSILRTDDLISFSYTSAGISTSLSPKDDADIDTITQHTLAAVNQLLASSRENGKFSMPFFVRYAYRLYDDSLTMQSAPILMLPSNAGTPMVLGNATASSNQVTFAGRAFIPSCQLTYALVGSQDELLRYSDIIKSVDIFVSLPIYEYDQSGKCKNIVTLSADDTFGIFALDDSINGKESVEGLTTPQLASLKKYSRRNILDTIKISDNYTSKFNHAVVLPKKERDEVMQSIADCAEFFLVKSIPIDKLSSTRTPVAISKNTLDALSNREQLTDDYGSHDTLMASSQYVYNSRLMLADMKKVLFGGYFNTPFAETYTAFAVDDPHQHVTPGESSTWLPYTVNSQSVEEKVCHRVQRILTYINKNGQDIVVEQRPQSIDADGTIHNHMLISSPVEFRSTPKIHYFFYPTTDAYKVEFVGYTENGMWKYRADLRNHIALNGSMFFDEFNPVTANLDISDQPMPLSLDDDTAGSDNAEKRTVHLPNRIYVSELDNPFLFPVKNIVAVGTGKVIGISSATQALSQGQFGQHPLYAFTSEGVWALAVAGTGTFKRDWDLADAGTFEAVMPISREVCLNAESITQLDNSVLFATKKGIMEISGSSIASVSDAIFHQGQDDLSSLPHFSDINGLPPMADTHLLAMPTAEFLYGCRMIYDYSSKHVIIYNPSTDNGTPVFHNAFVLSMKSGSWGTMKAYIATNVNSYPDAVAMTNDGRVVKFDGTIQPHAVETLFVTRPIKFESADVMKSVHSVVQFGNFHTAKIINGQVLPGDANTMLYASRDMQSWYLVASSKHNRIHNLRGTPFKYFRIASVARLKPTQSITGASIDVEPRHTNKMH